MVLYELVVVVSVSARICAEVFVRHVQNRSLMHFALLNWIIPAKVVFLLQENYKPYSELQPSIFEVDCVMFGYSVGGGA